MARYKHDFKEYGVLDIETTVNAKEPWSFAAAPEFAGNRPVLCGIRRPAYLHSGSPDITVCHDYPVDFESFVQGPRLLVGHNIKFDLKYMMKAYNCKPGHYPLWDTAIAEYMITGQKGKMLSLNEVAANYGLGQKQGGMSDLWAMGVKTENMDLKTLADYLLRDLELTEQVYLKQLELLDMAGAHMMKEHIVRCSTASWFYARAELRGMFINPNMLQAEISKQTTARDDALERTYKAIEEGYGIPPTVRGDWNPMAPSVLGRALHGLPITVTSEEPGLRILKSGQPAKRKRKISTEFTPHSEWRKDQRPPVMGGNNQILVPAERLAEVASAWPGHWAQDVLDYRTSEKLLGTYLLPIDDFTTRSGSGGYIHPQWNLTTTNTGRTSCNKPNAQNLPPEVEKMITSGDSRWKIVKADFKQLQIVGLALLTKDPQLIKDLQDGNDIHYETGKSVFGWQDPKDMNKGDRRVVKNTNFGLIFGGSAGGIAKQTGVHKRMVQQCIDAFFARYPKVKEWQEKMIKQVEDSATPIPEEFHNGDQVREGFLRTPLGRLLRFEEREAPPWLVAKTHRSVGFSPNEIVCYPVQGYTDGDIVPAFLNELVPLMNDATLIPINMVHDSVWLLTNDPEVTKVHLNTALQYVNTSLMLEVPLKLDITVEEV